MKAITICQPYAELIMRVTKHNVAIKRTENRSWPSRFRGQLAIHAGKSTSMLDLVYPHADGADNKYVESQKQDRRYGIYLNEMAFGAIVGVVEMIDCVSMADIESGACDERHPWIQAHPHAQGPYCHVYANPRRLAKPAPYRGQQGFFDVPDELLAF